MNLKGMLTTKEAAKFLDVKVETLHVYNSQRRIPYFKRGRNCYYRKEDLQNFLSKTMIKVRSNEQLETN